jgi:NAD(P)H-hydrate epimerase
MTLDDLPVLHAVPSVTAAQMAEADRFAIEQLGIGGDRLMENAAHQIAASARLMLGAVHRKRIVALVGYGNNGGDAAGALRHLAGWGAEVIAEVVAHSERLRPSARRELEILASVPALVRHDEEERRALPGFPFPNADLLIDGLLGYSTRGAPRGAIATFIDAANQTGRPILAVDLPSGIDPDTGRPLGPPIKATATVTLACAKTGLLAPEAAAFVGKLLVADIGIPNVAFERLGVDIHDLFRDGDLVRVVA